MELGQALLDELEDIFLRNGVDLVWSGHTHNYQRTCAVAKGRCVDGRGGGGGGDGPQQQRAPVYVIHGHGGAVAACCGGSAAPGIVCPYEPGRQRYRRTCQSSCRMAPRTRIQHSPRFLPQVPGYFRASLRHPLRSSARCPSSMATFARRRTAPLSRWRR